MCVYCSMICKNGDNDNDFLIEKNINLGVLGKIRVDGLIMYHKKDNEVVPIIDWGARGEEDLVIIQTEINYCPICGKDLKAFAKEHLAEGGDF